MNHLIDNLIRFSYLKSEPIIDAFRSINRIEFVPVELESQAEANIPLPIGFGQTISQPQTVAIMLELLDPRAGQKILDVGSGSGWTTALLCHIVGKGGKVIGVERVEKLLAFGRNNVAKFSFVKKGIASFVLGDGTDGYESEAPFDRILVSAMAQAVPEPLKKQLKVGGKMVIPVGSSIWHIEKKSESEFHEEEHRGFAFVPLIGKDGN